MHYQYKVYQSCFSSIFCCALFSGLYDTNAKVMVIYADANHTKRSMLFGDVGWFYMKFKLLLQLILPMG